MNTSKKHEHKQVTRGQNMKVKEHQTEKDTKLHAYQNKEEREPDTKYSVTKNKSMGQTNKRKNMNRTNANHEQGT